MIKKNSSGKGATPGLEEHKTSLCNHKITAESDNHTPELLNHPQPMDEKKAQSHDRLTRDEIDSFEFDGPCTD